MGRDRLLTVATFLSLLVAGMAVGVWSTFLVPLRLAGGVEGVADVVGLVGTVGLGLLGAWGTRSVSAAAVPGLGLVLVVAVASMSGPGNDLVLPGGLASDPGIAVVAQLLLLAGLLGVGVAVVLSARWLRRLHSNGRPAED